MFTGKREFTKIDIVLCMYTQLLTYGYLYKKDFTNKFKLTDKTFYRYISQIRNTLAEFNFYNLDLIYDVGKERYILKSYSSLGCLKN